MKLMKIDESQSEEMVDLHHEVGESITTNDEYPSEIVLHAQKSISNDENGESANNIVKNVLLLGTDQNLTITHINLKVKESS